MQAQVAGKFRRSDLRVSPRLALAGLAVLLLLFAYLTLPPVPLQFTQFSGSIPPSLSVTAGPHNMVTYQLTLHNGSIIPIEVMGIEAVPGQPLRPVGVQVMPDEGGSSSTPFRTFTLPPFESVYLVVTSRAVCGAQQDSLRVRYSFFGIRRTNDLSFGGPVTVERFGCPSVALDVVSLPRVA